MTKIKDNIFLILGVTLPVLIVTFVWILRVAHQRNIPPPQYSFIYVENYYSQNRIVVEDNAVYVITNKAPVATSTHQESQPKQQSKLYLYDIQTQSANELPYTAPLPNPDNEQKTLIFKMNNATLKTDYQAPDGYSFEMRAQGGGSGMVFGGYNHGYAYEYHLKKDGKRYPLNIKKDTSSNSYAGYTQFLAWVVPNGSP